MSALSRAEFALRRAHGLFAFHWQAHGNDYGIGREIHAWRAAGLSRRGERLARALPRRWTASIRAYDPGADHGAGRASSRQRLLARGREDAAAAAERLAARPAPTRSSDRRLVTIVNDGALDAAARGLRQAARHASALTRRPPPSLKRASTMKGRPGAG